MSIERRCDGCGITAPVDNMNGWLRALPLVGGWSYEFHDENCCALHIEELAGVAKKLLADAAAAARPVTP